jgi:hypothetical protein
MSAIVIPFRPKPEPEPQPDRPKFTEAELARRTRILTKHAVEYGLSITVHGQYGEPRS